jgi:hypothetical protein
MAGSAQAGAADDRALARVLHGSLNAPAAAGRRAMSARQGGGSGVDGGGASGGGRVTGKKRRVSFSAQPPTEPKERAPARARPAEPAAPSPAARGTRGRTPGLIMRAVQLQSYRVFPPCRLVTRYHNPIGPQIRAPPPKCANIALLMPPFFILPWAPFMQHLSHNETF